MTDNTITSAGANHSAANNNSKKVRIIEDIEAQKMQYEEPEDQGNSSQGFPLRENNKGSTLSKKKIMQSQTSLLLQNLLEFKVETSPSLKRKVDYYFTPYNPGYMMDKHMKFDEQELNLKS